MKKILKYLIKKILKNNNWKLEKIVQPRDYNLKAPEEVMLTKIRNSKGILHVGAHRGSEAPVYEWFGKKVIWIEANPEIFKALKENLFKYKFQEAFCELLLDTKDKYYDFFLSNNDGASSSIFQFGQLIVGPNKTWSRTLKMNGKIKLKSNTLDEFVKSNKIEIKDYNHWIIDVQGSELSFFKGSSNSLKNCQSINVEISTGEIYKNGSTWLEVKKLLNKEGFTSTKEPDQDHMDILFIRK